VAFVNPLSHISKHLQRPGKRVKTPTLLQMEAVECGAAALGIILGYYGRTVPLPELRIECGVSRDGSKASNLVKAARRYGMQAKGFKKGLDTLQALPVPYIVFWNFNHFLVVEGFNKKRVYLNDPASGPRSVSWQEFDQGYTGVVLVMEPSSEFQKGGQKPTITYALWRRLKGAKLALLYTTIIGFLLVIPGLAIPVFSQMFVDYVLIEGREDWLSSIILGIAIALSLRGILKFLQLRYLRKLRLKLAVGMSGKFLWHLLRLPIRFYAQRFAGEISNRVSLNNRVADLLSGELVTTIIDSVMVLFYAAIMFTYDWQLTLIGSFFSLINVVILQGVSRYRIDANLRLVQDRGKVAGVSIAGLQSIETIKASASESDFFARWSGYYTKYINAQQNLEITSSTLSILPSFLQSLTFAFILIIGGFRVMSGDITIGMLVAFQLLMQNFLEPVIRLVSFGGKLQDLEGSLNRLEDVLQNDTDEILNEEQILPYTFTNPKLEGYVELCNVTFGYSHVDSPLIENFNLKIQPGQRIALVGGSGSGKSTVAKLMTGLYTPWEGEILFDGQLRNKIPRTVLANSLSVVEQDIFLFSGTVRENLTLWDTTISDLNIIRACEDAVIQEVILALPGGYEGQLMEGGVNLSGGQRQRLELARSLVNNPSILIMDEATSALDTETEQIVDRNLRKRGCTCILVAHRLSTIRDCDEIVVLDQGKIVERGTHEELLAQGGLYSKLIKSE